MAIMQSRRLPATTWPGGAIVAEPFRTDKRVMSCIAPTRSSGDFCRRPIRPLARNHRQAPKAAQAYGHLSSGRAAGAARGGAEHAARTRRSGDITPRTRK